jgi:transcription elongation factor GreA
VAFVGATSALESVQAFKIEEFLKLQVSTSTSPRLYMEALKAYFAFAHKAGHISADPMKNVRLPRATGIAATAARRTAAAAASAVNVANRDGAPVASRTVEVEYVTRVRQQEMIAELDRLRIDERHRISALLEEAIKDGDLSENAGYDDAKMRQGLLEARIRELEDKLRRAALIEDQNVDVATVGVGSRVTLRDLQDDEEVVYTVVGPEETDPARFRISHRSPVGKAMLGKRQGEEADVTTPSGTHRYRIVSVEREA